MLNNNNDFTRSINKRAQCTAWFDSNVLLLSMERKQFTLMNKKLRQCYIIDNISVILIRRGGNVQNVNTGPCLFNPL